MTFEDLKKLYLKKKSAVGEEAYKYVSQILKEAKVLHKRNWKKNPTAGGDHEQSWRAFKGKNMEKLILFIRLTTLKMVQKSTRRGECNLTLSLRDVPLLSQGEGRFGIAEKG